MSNTRQQTMESRIDALERGLKAMDDRLSGELSTLKDSMASIRDLLAGLLAEKNKSSDGSGGGTSSNLNLEAHSEVGPRLSGTDTTASSPNFTPGAPHVSLPMFDGIGAEGWLTRIEQYFQLHNILEANRLDVALVAMEGDALPWFQWVRATSPTMGWSGFKLEMVVGMGPRRIMSVLVKEYGGINKVGFTEVDCRNYMRNNRQRSMEGDIQLLLDYLKQKQGENLDFFYAVQGDEDQFAGNVFWADPKARSDYNHFGDTVTFDTTYRSNRYRLPFAPFTGLNHHGQPVLFGCAFMINESEASFVWLFKTWLEAMSGRSPVSITTEHDSVIRSAIMSVFPDTRHRFCKWHIFKQCQEKLSHVLLDHPQFEAAFHKCVNLSENTKQFESCWHSLVDKYNLREHKWVQAIYADRRQWVPLYLRDTFFAEMSITQRSDSMNSYFDGYVNASTNLQQFFKLYEKALESRHEKEVKADFDTMNTSPSLKTPSPMEKQASEFYTRKIFMRFQDELVSTLTFMASTVDDDEEVISYQVSKFGEEHKSYHVRFNVLEMRATCSCQMFEFSGLLCRHVLAVFRVTNILTLPSHYILKRWTRNAKSSGTLEERVSDPYHSYLESHTVRYNTLRHEAFKFVDEGAVSLDSYNVVMAALAEASDKVALASKSEGKSSLANGRMRDVSTRIITQAAEAPGSSTQQLSEDDMDHKINELSLGVERANRKCEVYRTNLLSLLKDIEDHKQRLSIEVENVKLSMKDAL